MTQKSERVSRREGGKISPIGLAEAINTLVLTFFCPTVSNNPYFIGCAADYKSADSYISSKLCCFVVVYCWCVSAKPGGT